MVMFHREAIPLDCAKALEFLKTQPAIRGYYLALAAINSRGTRRDFVDLYCLHAIAPLERLIELAEKKYSDRPGFLDITARALAYFEDAEQQPMPRMLTQIRWADARKYCEQGARWLVKRQRARYR